MNANASGTLPVIPASLNWKPDGAAYPEPSPARIFDAIFCASMSCVSVTVTPGTGSNPGTPIPNRWMLVPWTRHISIARIHGPYAERSSDRPAQFAPSFSCTYQSSDFAAIMSLTPVIVFCRAPLRAPVPFSTSMLLID
jgi:hypothetical protein